MSSRYSNESSRSIENYRNHRRNKNEEPSVNSDIEHYRKHYDSSESDIEHFSVKRYGYPISIVFLFVVIGVLGFLLYNCKNPVKVEVPVPVTPSV